MILYFKKLSNFDRASVFILEFVTPNEFLWFWWKIIVPIPALESSNKNNVHFRSGGLEKIDFAKNGFGAETGLKSVLAWDFRNLYKLWSPRIAGSTKKSARHGCQDANFDFCNTPCTGTRLQKVIHFQMVFRWFSKVWKFRCIFCTPQAFWASHFLKLQNWRSPNVTLTVVSWTTTLAAWEVFKKLEFAFLRPQDELFFVLRA